MLSVSENDRAYIAHAQTVNKNSACGHLARDIYVYAVGFNNITDRADNDIAFGNAQRNGKVGTLFKVLIFAVHGDKELRTCQGHDKLQLLLTGMTRYVNIVHSLINNLCPRLEKLVYNSCNELFISRDRRCAYYDIVHGSYGNASVLVHRHSCKSGHRLALTACGDKHDLFGRICVHSFNVDDYSLGNGKISHLHSRRNNVEHTSAEYRNLAVILNGIVDYLLNAVNVGGKGSNDNSLALSLCKQLFKGLAHLAFRCGISGTFRICGISHKGKNAPVAQLAEACKVDDAAVNGSEIHLEVACVDNHACGSVNSKTHSVGYGVIYSYEFNRHAAHLYSLSRSDNVKLGAAEKIMLLELSFDKSHREPCCIHGNIYLFKQIRKTAYVILMTVSDYNASYSCGILLNIGKIGDNQVNAGHIAVREGKTAVNDKNVVAAFKEGHVLADLVQTAQRDYFKGCTLYSAVIGAENRIYARAFGLLLLTRLIVTLSVPVCGVIPSLEASLRSIGGGTLVLLFKGRFFKGYPLGRLVHVTSVGFCIGLAEVSRSLIAAL